MAIMSHIKTKTLKPSQDKMLNIFLMIICTSLCFAHANLLHILFVIFLYAYTVYINLL